MDFPADATVIDLRAEALRLRDPLPHPRVVPLTLEEIEDGGHGLSVQGGPFVVVCERGARAGLAARYLRADGLDAHAWEG